LTDFQNSFTVELAVNLQQHYYQFGAVLHIPTFRC